MLLHNRIRRSALAAACTVFLVSGCDFLDPTNVVNPSTTTEDLAEAREPTKALLGGVRAQMARAVGGVAVTTELVSDNMEIAFTNIGGELAGPYQLNPEGASFNSTGGIGAYWNLQELRALSDFLIDTIAPGDDNATAEQLAEAHFFRGMAFLMQGENFIGVPTEPGSQPATPAELLGLAAQDFTAGRGQSPTPELDVALLGALARTHRALGNATEARNFAEDALAADDEFVWLQGYGAGEIENPFPFNTRSFQPLPRLDFLDPKFTTRDTGIPLVKAEEMHLIIAEVEMSEGDYAAAQAAIADAIELAETRPLGTMNDIDQRGSADLTIRPRDAGILIAAEPGAPLRGGLVITRPGNVTVPAVSGTSLNPDSVLTLGSNVEIRHSFWLARQEILFSEGRRLNDLGVLMPIMQREIDASPVLTVADWGEPSVPSYIPEGIVMDNFSPRSPYVDDRNGGALETNEVTIEVDVNRILAVEAVSKFGPLP